METLRERLKGEGQGWGWDVSCPLRCGRCCTESIYLREEDHIELPAAREKKGGNCPLLGPHGCKARRQDRPVCCTGFICPVAQAVALKELTKEEGLRIVRRQRPWLYRQGEWFWKTELHKRTTVRLKNLEKRRQRQARKLARAS